MRTDMRGKDFVTLMDYTGEEIQTILDVAFDLKRQNAMGAEHELLKNKTLGMIFAQPSTRTRVSFETGMTQLGGHAQYYSEDNMQRKNKETWEDTGLVLSRYLDALMVRLYDLEKYGMARDIMNEIRKATTIPVINGLDDKEHPCQCMGDIDPAEAGHRGRKKMGRAGRTPRKFRRPRPCDCLQPAGRRPDAGYRRAS
ncbi:MAG: ornithine carbamoyltransferase [Ruthenibacterium sp.]